MAHPFRPLLFYSSYVVISAGIAVMLHLDAQLITVSRSEILSRAREYTEVRWLPIDQNLRAPCIAGYRSDFQLGLQQVGEAYRWGGNDTPADFVAKLTKGLGAGAHALHHEDPRRPCTTGIDCSGFVCNVWKHNHVQTALFSGFTAELPDFSRMDVGDAFLKQGTHVILFVGLREDGNPRIFEASGKRVHEVKGADWDYVQDYVPVRYQHIVH